MSLEQVSDRHLIRFARNLKKGMMQVIDMPAGRRETPKDEKSCPPTASFALNVLLLEGVEREIRRRGYDPADPRYGRNLLAEIEDVRNTLPDRCHS